MTELRHGAVPVALTRWGGAVVEGRLALPLHAVDDRAGARSVGTHLTRDAQLRAVLGRLALRSGAAQLRRTVTLGQPDAGRDLRLIGFVDAAQSQIILVHPQGVVPVAPRQRRGRPEQGDEHHP